MGERFLSVKEVAEIMGCSSQMVYYYIKHGHLKPIEEGKNIFTRAAIHECLYNRPTPGRPKGSTKKNGPGRKKGGTNMKKEKPT